MCHTLCSRLRIIWFKVPRCHLSSKQTQETLTVGDKLLKYNMQEYIHRRFKYVTQSSPSDPMPTYNFMRQPVGVTKDHFVSNNI
jgi:hypothetical protein